MDFRTRYIVEVLEGAGFRCWHDGWYLAVSRGDSKLRCFIVARVDRAVVYDQHLHDGGLGDKVAYVFIVIRVLLILWLSWWRG